MKIKVEIIKVSTGEKRIYETDCDPCVPTDIAYGEVEHAPEFPKFIWTDGNYACDCNRAIFFESATDNDGDCPCGNTAYKIPRILLEDGREIVIDASS